MLIDLTSLRRAFEFIPANLGIVLVGGGLYGLVFAVQSHFTALVGAGQDGAAVPAFLAAAAAFVAFVVAMSAWGRAALDKSPGSLMGLAFGRDETKLLLAALLVLILTFTVLGTAGLAVLFMSIALAVINVDPKDEPPAPGEVSALELYGTGEWIVFGVIIGVYALFSLWFFLRLALAYPATLDAGRIQIMRIWPLSGHGRSLRILSTAVLAGLPGVGVLALMNFAMASSFGAYPAAAQSAAGVDGQLVIAAPLFFALSFVYGVGKAVLIGAPVCAALCVLYKTLKDQPEGHNF